MPRVSPFVPVCPLGPLLCWRRPPPPLQLPVHLKVMYTRPVVSLASTFKVNRHLVLEDPEDLDLEWLNKELGIVIK